MATKRVKSNPGLLGELGLPVGLLMALWWWWEAKKASSGMQ